ncbi:MAG: formylglycine-generating enzyme family protein [Candidatus Poribacteria bacterium]|nr:formylglycine-generating enzyme family protein [Candidatus Poribacteria bacterium]
MKSNREVESLPWVLKVALAEAKQFKESVSNETVKIRAQVEIEAESQRGRIESAVVEDLVQGLRDELMGQDGAGMVRIPAGSFQMGSRDGESNETPVHKVQLDAFYMDVHEVTVGQFREFVNQSGCSYEGDWDDVAKYSAGDDYPMIYVTWSDATAYAKWVGKRLPTEAEWEYAARGGLAGKRYPWGDEMTKAHYGSWNGGRGTTKAVGSFGVNRYGLYDMAGNVWEWCQDWYSKDYYQNSPTKNPPGPDTGSKRVLRGGSWGSTTSPLRVALRNDSPPNSGGNSAGFRCVSGSP